MSLRLAERIDIPAMHRVRVAVRENRLSDPARITEADYIAAIEDLGRTWVIEAGGEVVAFASGYLVRPDTAPTSTAPVRN